MNLIDKEFYTKDDIQETFNVSGDTVNNWFKTGAIPDLYRHDRFTKEEFMNIIAGLLSSAKLKGRANRFLADQDSVFYLGITDRKEGSS